MTRSGFALTFVLVMAAGACHDPNRYVPSSPDNPDGTLASPILDLTTDQSSIRSTGAAHATITAKIDPRSSIKTMKFSTSKGKVSAAGQISTPEKPEISVPVSDSGVVTVDLQSSTDPGLATVTATITKPDTTSPRTFTRTVDVAFTAVSSTDVITLTATPTTADADGASVVTLTARFLLPEVAQVNNIVTFTASAGEFMSFKDSTSASPQAKVPVNGDVATVPLKSPLQQGTVTVTARIGTFSTQALIVYTRANPDTIFVQPAKSSVARIGGTVVITAFLLRDVGQIADNMAVSYEIRDSAGDPIGTFLAPSLAVKDDQDSGEFKRLKSTAVLDPDDTAALGAATITVRAGGKTATTLIQITN